MGGGYLSTWLKLLIMVLLIFNTNLSAQIPFNTSTVAEQLIPGFGSGDHYNSIVTTGCDAVDDVRAAVCDGTRPQLYWQVGTHTGYTLLNHLDAKNTDVAILHDGTTRYFAVVAYYRTGYNGIFLEGYELNLSTNDFDFIPSTGSYPNPVNVGATTGFHCQGTVNIDADEHLQFVVVFDEGSSTSLTHSMAISGLVSTSLGNVVVASSTGVKLANPSNNGNLANYQPDVSLAYKYIGSDLFVYSYFTFITEDDQGITRVNVERNDQYPTYGDLDDATSSHNEFWQGRPNHDDVAHPAISSHPDYAGYPDEWVVAVEDLDTYLSDINMYTPSTAPGVNLEVLTVDLLSSLHLTLYENTRPDVCYDYQSEAANITWNFFNTDYSPLFYEPIAIRYSFTGTPGYQIQGTPVSPYAPYTEVPDLNLCDTCKHSLAVSTGGRFANYLINSNASGKVYSYYNNIDNEWYFKAVDGDALRIAPSIVQQQAINLNESFSNIFHQMLNTSNVICNLYNLEGKLLLTSQGDGANIAHDLQAKSRQLNQGIYLVKISSSTQGITSLKAIKF